MVFAMFTGMAVLGLAAGVAMNAGHHHARPHHAPAR
jgi:hypothetical protein